MKIREKCQDKRKTGWVEMLSWNNNKEVISTYHFSYLPLSNKILHKLQNQKKTDYSISNGMKFWQKLLRYHLCNFIFDCTEVEVEV